jgi:hypothetical protein
MSHIIFLRRKEIKRHSKQNHRRIIRRKHTDQILRLTLHKTISLNLQQSNFPQWHTR